MDFSSVYYLIQKPRVIGFDIDDVIVATNAAVRNACENELHREWIPNTDYECTNWPQEYSKAVMPLYYRVDIISTAKLEHPRIPYLLNRMIDDPRYSVHFVTARNPGREDLYDKTLWQLHNCGINVTPTMLNMTAGDKTEAFRRLGLDILYDDGWHNIRAAQEAGTPGVLISNDITTYNHGNRAEAERLGVPVYPDLPTALICQEFNGR